MKSYFKLLNVLLCLVVLAQTVLGYGFGIEVTPVRDQITKAESADFNLTITNNLEVKNEIRISAGDFTHWTFQTRPQSARLSGVALEPTETATVTLLLFPTKIVTPGRYTVKLEVNSETTSEEIRKNLDVNYVSLESILTRRYVPDISVTINLPDKGYIDPRGDENGETVIDVGVKNKNPLHLKDIKVRLRSNLFDEERTIEDIGPLERKFASFNIKLDPMELPKKETIVATGIVDNITFVDFDTFGIKGYEVPFTKTSNEESMFLKKAISIEVTNPSNVQKEESVFLKTTFISSLFTTSSPKAKITKQNGVRYVTWDLTLPPGGGMVVYATTNYRPFYYVLILILIGIVLYYTMRSPIIISKSVKEISRKEGGIFKFKVILHVKNRSKHNLHNLEVSDSVPSIADIERDEKPGSLHLSKILKHPHGGSVAKWEIENFEAREERVLTYIVKAKLAILGTLAIPVAKVKFVGRKGKRIVSKSNIVKLNA